MSRDPDPVLTASGIRLAAGLCFALSVATASFAGERSYPNRPLTLVVAWPAGGTTDIIARIVADSLGKELGQSVQVVNKPGAGGSIGLSDVLGRARDGYTLAMVTLGDLILTPQANARAYSPADFVALAQITRRDIAIAVPAKSRWRTIAEYLEHARLHPGQLSFAAVSQNAGFLACRRLHRLSGSQLLHVPVQGGAQAAAGLLGGHWDSACDSVSSFQPYLADGTVRLLGIFGPSGAASNEPLPIGYDVGISAFTGLAAAAGTPPEIVEELRRAITRSLARSEFLDRIIRVGEKPIILDGQAFELSWAREWDNAIRLRAAENVAEPKT